MVMPGQSLLCELPWMKAAIDYTALLTGQIPSAQVSRWQQHARRVFVPHAGGQLLVHHWQPGQTNAQAPVVLLHGGSGSWTHWVRSIAPLLAAGHAIWAIDLPGFGDSDAIPGVMDADGMLETLAMALQRLFRWQPVQLIGFSFGAMTAGMLVARYPHLAQHLVLVGAPGLGLNAHPPLRLKGWRHLKEPHAQLACHLFNLKTLMLAYPQNLDQDTLALHIANVRRDNLPRRRLSSTDVLLHALAEVTCPVTAIYGEHDALYPGLLDDVEARMAACTRRFQGLHRISGAGHWVQYESPQAFHKVLLPRLICQQPDICSS